MNMSESEPVEVVVDPVIAELQTLYTEEEIQGIIDLKKRQRSYRAGGDSHESQINA